MMRVWTVVIKYTMLTRVFRVRQPYHGHLLQGIEETWPLAAKQRDAAICIQSKRGGDVSMRLDSRIHPPGGTNLASGPEGETMRASHGADALSENSLMHEYTFSHETIAYMTFK